MTELPLNEIVGNPLRVLDVTVGAPANNSALLFVPDLSSHDVIAVLLGTSNPDPRISDPSNHPVT